jgi:hypothetical protein
VAVSTTNHILANAASPKETMPIIGSGPFRLRVL